MERKNTKQINNDIIKVKGFFRLQITEDNTGKTKVVGDSGWMPNQVVNTGIRDYLVDHILGSSEKFVRYANLGTGTAPASDATALQGELQHAVNNNRLLITGGTSIVASRTAQWTGQFASANSFVTAGVTLQNVGLFNGQSDTTVDIFAGNTYTTSALATNQSVNFTYQIQIS